MKTIHATTDRPTLGPAASPDISPAPAAAVTLQALLDEGVGLWPEYQDQLSSHLPMALEALLSLGADSARLLDFQRRYAARLRPLPLPLPSSTETDGSHAAGFGRIADYPAWLAHYRQALAAQGRDALLRKELPQLMPGVGGAAFHGLIRLGHALRHGHAGETAAALAYWACRHQPLPAPTDSRPMPLPDWLAALRALPAGDEAQAGLISGRMAAWARREDFRALAGRLPADDLPALARASAALYANTGNFTVLHMVTASAALQQLGPWLDTDAPRHFIHAAAAALLASGQAARRIKPNEAGGAPPDWPALAAAAIAQQDDHVIKLVAACRQLEAGEARPPQDARLWRRAAARALQGKAQAP